MRLNSNGTRAGFDGTDAGVRGEGAVGTSAERDLPAVDVRRGLEGTVGGGGGKWEEGSVEWRRDVGGIVVRGERLQDKGRNVSNAGNYARRRDRRTRHA